MKKNVIYLFFVLFFIGVFSFQIKAQTIDISGSIEKGLVKKGSIGKGLIILSIPDELHTNSNKPSSEFLIPTTVKLVSNQVKITQIIYPKGKNQKFEFSETPINVYEGRTIIKFSFRVPTNLKTKDVRIRAVVSYQACTNEVCYQPAKKEIFLKAKVK